VDQGGNFVSKTSLRPIHPLTGEDVIRLFRVVSAGKGPKVIRDRAILAVLLSAGIGMEELVSLRVSQVSFDERCIRLKKNGVERDIPLLSLVVQALRVYFMEARPKLLAKYVALGKSDEETFFLNNYGARLSRQGCWLALKTL
jgi:integrase/recombinase XerD